MTDILDFEPTMLASTPKSRGTQLAKNDKKTYFKDFDKSNRKKTGEMNRKRGLAHQELIAFKRKLPSGS